MLGNERFDFYRATNADVESSAFGMFGLNQTTIAVRPLKPGDQQSSTSSSHLTPAGTWEVRAEVDATFLRVRYPEIYQKMVTTGVWKK